MSDAKRLFKMDSTGMVSSFRPATPDEIKEAHAELCEREGMKRYELCGQVLWLTDEAVETITYYSRGGHE